MRKLLLLLICFTSLTHFINAQVNTVFIERFDPPSGADSVVHGAFTGSTPTTAFPWTTTTNVAVSTPNSFWRKGSVNSGTGTRIHYFQTQAFDTEEFVFLEFKHIAKIFYLNAARIKVSLDSGATFPHVVSGTHYRGKSSFFPTTNYFNDASYSTLGDPWFTGVYTGPYSVPDNSWWRTETFDLSGLASDTTNHQGYSNVVIRFEFEVTNSINAVDPNFPPNSTAAGWYVDDVVVTVAGCELEPPKIEWGIQPIPCFFNNPEGSIVAKSNSATSSYTIAARVTDRLSGIDSVVLYYRIAPTTTWSNVTMQLNPNLGTPDPNNIYSADIPGVAVHDTVYYYIVAWDNSCPNTTKSPDINTAFKFWTNPSLPPMCGLTNCNKFPETIDIPNLITDPATGTIWFEGFEAARWVPGNNGTTNNNNAHRGAFPVFPDGGWLVSPSVLGPNNAYAWCVANGPTANSPYTGPAANHTPGGSKYIYAEYSWGTVPPPPNDIPVNTILETPCINLTEETRCLAFEFYYHMFGSSHDGSAISKSSVLRADILVSNDPNNWVTAKRVVGQTHFSPNDPWKKLVFPLGDYNGHYVKVRFFAVKKENDPTKRGDIAIDDARIFVPDPADFEVMELKSPKNGFCYYSNQEPIQFVIRNNGCQTPSAIPIGFKVLPTGVTLWDTIRTPIRLGDTLTYTFTPKADLSAYNIYTIKAFTALPGDIRRGNDTVTSELIEYTAPISTFPYIEDFEDAGAPLSQNLGNDRFRFMNGLNPQFRWVIGEGLTPTRNTGPFSGYYFGGKYLYTRTDGGIAVNTDLETYFRSVCLDLTDPNLTAPAFDFYYHMFGSTAIDKLEIQVSKANEDLTTWTTLPGSTILPAGQQLKELDDWKLKTVDLSAYAGQTIKVRFKASRKEFSFTPPDPSAPAFEANVAIDKIMVHNRLANDVGAHAITEPRTAIAEGATFDPKVKVANFGSTAVSSVPITIAITELCGSNQGQTTTYSGTVNTSNLASGAVSPAISVSGLNIAWPEGEFEMCIYTSLGGDNNTFNDTVCRTITGHDKYDIPTRTNFDSCNYSEYGFYIGDNYDTAPGIRNSLRQWQLGVPSAQRIRRAHTQPNAWVTNLRGSYLNNTDEFLNVPLLDNFDTIVKAEIRFYQNIDMPRASPTRESNTVGAVEYLDTNNNWKSVGYDNLVQNVGTNWYFSNIGALSLDLLDGQPGFTGQSNGNWLFSTYPLYELNYSTPPQKLRFHFKSNSRGGSNFEGWGIDDFEMYVPPQNSASPIKIRTVSPIIFPQQRQELLYTIENTGAKNLENFIVMIKIDGVLIGVDTLVAPSSRFPVPLLTGEKRTFKLEPQRWEPNLVTVGLHDVLVVTSRPNHKQDNLVEDDTLKWSFTVLDTVDFRQGADTMYCNDFEKNNGIAPWLPLNSHTYQEGNFSWQWGPPNQFGLAHSGNDVWVTGIDENYPERDSSALLSPIFLVDSGQALEMDFWHWFRTEDFHDGGNVEVSFNGGQVWFPIGYALKSKKDWYNTQFVTSLDIIRPGWSGESNGWDSANQVFAFDHNVKAIFRFRFASDYDIEDNGWALDDFCIRHTTKNPSFYIGKGENNIPKEAIVADLSPNPARFESSLGLYVPTPKKAGLIVVNSVGQVIENRDLKLDEGVNNIRFDSSRWESGLYIIKLNIEGEVITRKLIIAH